MQAIATVPKADTSTSNKNQNLTKTLHIQEYEFQQLIHEFWDVYMIELLENGAGRRNRTDDACVEDRSFTSKLYPLKPTKSHSKEFRSSVEF